jgi:uncharacterized membrane protein YkoI
MKIRSLMVAALMLASAPALADKGRSHGAPDGMARVVDALESRYQGDVVGIRYDAAGDAPAHYHVDLRYPGPVLLALDVDASTLEVVRAPREGGPDPRAATLADAAALAASNLGGEVTAIAFEAGPGPSTRYDVDVRVADGRTARLTVDPVTQQIAWRNPPVGFR